MQASKILLLLAIFLIAHKLVSSQPKKGDTIKSIANEMALNDIYERTETVGYAGSPLRKLELFKKLRLTASETELTELAANNQNAVVRSYAFQALKLKTKIIEEKLLKKFRSETTVVVTLAGCFGDEKPINSLAFKVLVQ